MPRPHSWHNWKPAHRLHASPCSQRQQHASPDSQWPSRQPRPQEDRLLPQSRHTSLQCRGFHCHYLCYAITCGCVESVSALSHKGMMMMIVQCRWYPMSNMLSFPLFHCHSAKASRAIVGYVICNTCLDRSSTAHLHLYCSPPCISLFPGVHSQLHVLCWSPQLCNYPDTLRHPLVFLLSCARTYFNSSLCVITFQSPLPHCYSIWSVDHPVWLLM